MPIIARKLRIAKAGIVKWQRLTQNENSTLDGRSFLCGAGRYLSARPISVTWNSSSFDVAAMHVDGHAVRLINNRDLQPVRRGLRRCGHSHHDMYLCTHVKGETLPVLARGADARIAMPGPVRSARLVRSMTKSLVAEGISIPRWIAGALMV